MLTNLEWMTALPQFAVLLKMLKFCMEYSSERRKAVERAGVHLAAITGYMNLALGMFQCPVHCSSATSATTVSVATTASTTMRVSSGYVRITPPWAASCKKQDTEYTVIHGFGQFFLALT